MPTQGSEIRINSKLLRRLQKLPQRPGKTWLGDCRPLGSASFLGEPLVITIWMDAESEFILCMDPQGDHQSGPEALFAAFVKGVLHTEKGIPAARPGRVAMRQEFLEPLRSVMGLLDVKTVALAESTLLDTAFEETVADLSGVFQSMERLLPTM